MNCTSVCIDIRGFSKFYEKIEAANDEEEISRLNTLENFFCICEKLVIDLFDKKDVDIILTGDGVIVLFQCPKAHHIHGYVFALILRNQLNKFFSINEINKELGFGIGVASGELRKMVFKSELLDVNYMSTGINRSARLEKLTKVFKSSEILLSNTTMWPVFSTLSSNLLKNFGFPAYEHLMNASKHAEQERDLVSARKYWNLMQEINEKYFFRFVSGYSIDGSSQTEVLYRFSRVLFETLGENLFSEVERYFQEPLVLKKLLNDF